MKKKINFNYKFNYFNNKNYSTWKNLKTIFSNSIFIYFSFINCFIPFFATMMAALNKPNGALDVIGIGLSVSFITIFNQFLFLTALCVNFVFRQQQQLDLFNKQHRQSVVSIMIISSIISIILFICLSFLYINFSGIYQNIDDSIHKGYKYIAIVSISLIFNSLIYMNIMIKYQEKKWYGWVLLTCMLCTNLIMIPILGVVIKWENYLSTFGIGLGITVSSLISFLITIIPNIKKGHYWFKINWKDIKFFIIKTKNFGINFLLSTIMKSILIMAVALSLGLAQKDTPPALMIVKIIWYNSLFFCGFFADGLFYAVEYSRLKKYPETQYPICMNTWNCLILIASLTTLLICVAFNFSAMQLAKLYVGNQLIDIVNPVGSIWPYGNLSPIEIQKYLWSPEGVYNFKLISVNTNGITIEQSKAFSLLYTTIYHVLINSTKMMSFTDVKYNQKFNFKKLISNFIVISLVMIFVVVFSVVPTSIGYIKAFPGIDGFSCGLMIVSIILFILTILGYLKKIKQNK